MTARKPVTATADLDDWIALTALSTAAEQGFGPHVTDPEALRIAAAGDPSWLTRPRSAAAARKAVRRVVNSNRRSDEQGPNAA